MVPPSVVSHERERGRGHPQPTTWTIYKVAADEREAIEEATREFGQHATILALTGRRS